MKVEEGWLFPWNIEIWERIYFQIMRAKLPHAILFSGIDGLGKGSFAKHLASFLMCDKFSENKFTRTDNDNFRGCCESCKSCYLFCSSTHPDFINIHLTENSSSIKIDQINQLIKFNSFSSHISNNRIVVINDAHFLNIKAANALLKILEEPSENFYIIIITNNLHDIPATIRSRCQNVRFDLPKENVSIKWLKSKLLKKVTSDKIVLAMKLSNGSPIKAFNLLI